MHPRMRLKKLFSCMLTTCVTLGLSAPPTVSQTLHPHYITPVADLRGTLQELVELDLANPVQVTMVADLKVNLPPENDPIVSIPLDADPASESAPSTEPPPTPSANPMRFDQLLLAAIDQRLGARYVYGAVGPHVFDCSGFVWSAFRSTGIDFDRTSARTLWAKFEPARENEEYKFGTLVFFKNLTHIGIVVDEKGFYHASRSHGVTYSPFNKYWQKRIDGFRRVPLPAPLMAMAE